MALMSPVGNFNSIDEVLFSRDRRRHILQWCGKSKEKDQFVVFQRILKLKVVF